MKFFLVIVILIGISLEITNATDFADPSDALEFLQQKRSLDLIKRFIYTGKEQRREAKEKYEEKCERKIISKALSKKRWCPELTEWPEWQKATAGSTKKSG